MPTGPGKSHRDGISLIELLDEVFPDNETAEAWFVKNRWPNGIHCPSCGSFNVQTDAPNKSQPFRCREKECRNRFSAKSGTVMHGSKLSYRTWGIAMYLCLTSLKGVSSVKLHRDLKVTQKTAWHLAHRIRKSLEANDGAFPFAGPVEVDETFIGGKRMNMSHSRRKAMAGLGRGGAGKEVVVGVKDRATNKVIAGHVQSTTKETLQGFVETVTAEDAKVYSDEAAAYKGMPRDHEAVNHKVGEYVRDMAHTNGMESFWSMMKRGYQGTYHKMSPKHLERYVTEFSGRHNVRDADTMAQLNEAAANMNGKRLRYADLTADNGLASGARRKKTAA